MAAVNNVVTRGYSIGTIALVTLRGYTAGPSTATDISKTVLTSGVWAPSIETIGAWTPSIETAGAWTPSEDQ